jgi:hypothetical protein
MLGYPEGWPSCAGGCGRPALDGHLTCGELPCDESAARDAIQRAYAATVARNRDHARREKRSLDVVNDDREVES